MGSPVFVCGLPRSGTHRVATLMAQKNGLRLLGEVDDFWTDNGYFKLFNGSLHYSPARTSVPLQFTRHFGSHCLDKTPFNIFRVPYLLEAFPDCCVIVVVRDEDEVRRSVQAKKSGNPAKVTATHRGYTGRLAILKHSVLYKLKKYKQYFSWRMAMRDVARIFLTIATTRSWGVRFDILVLGKAALIPRFLDEEELLAWGRRALRELQRHPETGHRLFILNYEDAITDPSSAIGTMAADVRN